MSKIDGNVVVGCITVIVFSAIVFGALTLNSTWNMTAKCRYEAERVSDRVLKEWEAKNAPR